MAVLIACPALIAWLVGAVVVVRVLTGRAWRIESADLTTSEQSYRLHRLVLGGVAVTGGYAILGLAVFSYASVAVNGSWATLAVVLCGAVVSVVPMIAGVRVTRRAYARVRGASIRAHGRRYVLLVTAVTAGTVAIGVTLGRTVLPPHGITHLVGMLVIYLVVLVVVQVLLAPLLIVSLRARPLPDETRRRLSRLARRMGVRVRDIRAVPGREQRLANAAQIGAVPGLRYIVVTDYLLDELEPDEVDAVVAHELGHVRGHHLTVKLLAIFAVWAALEAAVLGLHELTGGGSPWLLLIPVFVAFPLGLVLLQGLVGARFEQRADDAAAGAVGGGRLVSALEAIARLNGVPHDSGRVWSVLTQHPGQDERLRRLRTRVPATTGRIPVRMS